MFGDAATNFETRNYQLQDNFVSALGHIVKLDLSSNQLAELPETFGNLSLLQHLDLFDNKLTKLPVAFFKVSVLYESVYS